MVTVLLYQLMPSFLPRLLSFLVIGLLGVGLFDSRGQCLPASVCRPGNAPVSASAYKMGILRVRLAGLDTTTAAGQEGYQDYSCRRMIRLDRGTTYELRVATGLGADENLRAWIDYNQDGTFDPVTEQVLSSRGKQHVGTFTVPTALPVGAALRLRLAADYVDAPVPGPCTTPQFSQTEDYQIVLTAAAPPAPLVAFRVNDSVACPGPIQFYDASRNAPMTWRWDFGDGTFSSQQQPVHTYPAAGTYAVRLRACNTSGCDSLTKLAYITVRGGPKPIACQPTTQAYCCDFGVARVQVTGLDHRPGGGAAGYQDASCTQQATLHPDWPDTLRITTGGQAAHDVRVYVDLDDDGQFNPATELLYQGLGVTNPAAVLRLSSLSPGLVYNQPLRLRICADYAGSPAVGPCAAPKWGQVVDYAVQVLPNTRPPQAAFALTYAQVCGPVQVAMTNESINSARYRWDFGDGTTSSASTPPVHTYTTPGVYTLRLVAYSPTQADSTQREIAVATACPTYCTAGGWGGNEDSPLYFMRVKVADMDNQDNRGPRVGYRDFTRYVATVRQGQTVPVHTESRPFSSGGSGPWTQSVVWIDYNQDGQFGPSEQAGHYTGYSPQGGLIQIPHQAPLGATRMRLVIYLINDRYPSNGCSPEGTTAAIEDYTVIVLPEQVAPRSGFTADLAASCSGQVQFRDTTWSAPTSWRWDFGDGTSSTLANPLHTYATAGSYPVTLETRNAYGFHAVTRPNYVTVTGLGQGPRPAAVALSTGQLYENYGIAQAKIATLTYQGGENQPGYRDETCQQPALHLAAGSSYPLAVMRTDRFAYHFVYLWLDANDDGVFDPGEKIFISTSTSNIPLKEGTFTIPVTALRDRPLRLRLYWHGLRGDDYKTDWPVPDPQTRDEEYDQVRDFTVWVSATPLATAAEAPRPVWSFYPNPTTGLLTLLGLSGPQEVTLRNVLGQEVLRRSLVPTRTGTAYLDASSLAKGVYFIQLSSTLARQVVIY